MFASRLLRTTLSAALFLWMAAAISFAQTSFGRISGTVVDSTGAPMSGASVTVRNSETQFSRTATTDANGFYVATQLPIGPYTVEVNQQGFKRQTQTGLTLVADGRLTANFKLEVGEITQSVEVTAVAGETLNTVSGEVARVIDSKQVDNLALNGRTYTQLMTLVPGAVVTNPDQFSVTTSLSATNQTINGNRSDSSNLTVDGAFNLVAGSNGSLMNNVSPDFIQEVKLQTSNFSAEYGRTSGPAFNVVTKNGTNQFHGGLFEYFRNDALDARNFFSPQKPKLRFNDFGYDVGGPIKKDKLFFFVGEEWKRLRQVAQPTRQTVPTTAMLNGDFSGLKQTLFLPGTKTPIPNNNIASMITPDGRAIANVYRLMEQQAASFTDQAISNNVTLQPNNPLDYREDLVRLDYHLNDKHSIYGRWIQDSNQLIDPFGTFSGSNLPTTPTLRKRPGESFLVAHTWVISPSLVNEARANASWASQHIPPTGDTWQRSTYGFQFPQLFSGGNYNNGIPNVDITGYANFRGPAFALASPSTDIQFADTFTWLRGAHVIKTGFVYIRDRVDQNGRPAYTGALTFNTTGTNSTGYALADALLGNFRNYSEASADPYGFFRFSQTEAFIQDSWKVSSKLSLELGLRYQYLPPMYTQANNMANFAASLYDPAQAVTLTRNGRIVPGSGNPYNGLIRAGNGIPADELGRVPGGDSAAVNAVPAGAPRGFYDSQSRFGPRFGFAYSPDEKTVLRGGFGLFYYRPEGNLIFSQVNLPPFLQTPQFENGNLANPGGAAGVTAPVADISAIDPRLQTSYTEQFSFGVQRQIPLGLFLETDYVGNLGRHLIRQPDINIPAFAASAANAALPSSQQAATNFLRPYKGYSAINNYISDSTSNYHSLQVFLSKRAGDVTFTTGYTWAKALGDSSAFGDHPENYLDRHYSYGPLSYDRRHAFFGTFVWALPRLAKSNPAIRGVVGGWQLSGLIHLQSGNYNTITGVTPLSSTARRADYVGGDVLVPSGQRGPSAWINKSAFTLADPSRYGNSGVGIVEGPGLQTYDLSMGKYFYFTESINLRFQADFFNAFNNVNFNPSGLGTNITNGGFGAISSAFPARNLQLGLKLYF
jgi:hypothetical protein